MQPRTVPDGPPRIWKATPAFWALAALCVAAGVAAFLPGLRFMVATWGQVDEYSYGYFIPFVSAYLIWQCSDRLRLQPFPGAWSGLLLVIAGLLLGAVGALSAIRMLSQYGFVVALFGLAACGLGWRGLRVIAMPLAMLAFMIPLPQFLLRELSQQLQFISSALGVWLIRQFDISVFLEGNVIDLGSFKLQVVEACSGLRYLFPLMVLGFIAAYFFQAALWKRLLVLVSTVPMTIAINSLRIGLIGVTVDRWGPAMAEGLLHEFEGFFMFMLCVALLAGEMALLARLGTRRGSLRESFGLVPPTRLPADAAVAPRAIPRPAIAGGALLAAAALALLLAPERTQAPPPREAFAAFPMELPGGWHGRADSLAPDIVAWLAVDDYLLANYSRDGEPWVNLYSAWYGSQSGGGSTHSPRTCIPGGGWTITALSVASPPVEGGVLSVNRAVIEKGGQRQLAWYWFSQRGRTLTNELDVKWYILRDGIVRNRSDGALVRLVTPIGAGESEADADRRLTGFLSGVQPRLGAFVPG